MWGILGDDRRMEAFRETLVDCQLFDIGFSGVCFTWERGNLPETNIRERLDRGLRMRNHCLLILNTKKALHFTGSRKFHFEAWWTLEDFSEKVIREAWEVTGGTLLEKLRKLQICLEDWSRKNRQHREGLKKKLMQEMEDLVGRERNDETLAKIIDTKIHLNLEIDKDEMYWEQRERQNWSSSGIKTQLSFTDSEADKHNFDTGYKGRFGDRGGNLFKSKGVTDSCKVLDGIEKTVTQEDNEFLLAPYRADEIQVALEGMGPTKAPGADGFPALFFQRYWHVVGQDVIAFCLGILNNNQEFGDFNNTDIVLILKVPKPTHLVNFRPISLCSVIYKVVAKTIANRLQKIIDKCIDKVQSAFVPGRLITDNVLLAYKILHTLKQKRSGKKGVMVVKLDMSKAYDRAEWGFLEVVITKLGFPKDWTELLHRCITSVRYTVNINERKGNLFQPSRGLRQGDPLSPFLFLMCSEGLSSLMRTSMKRGSIKGVKASRKGPAISHLLFADDCIHFGEASPKGARILKDILQDYEKCSGQCVNFSKSIVFFSSNTIEEDKAIVSRLLGVRIASNPEKYLGLLNMIGRRKKESFQNLLDRISMRIDGWSNKMLSQRGKEVFIKSVLQAIPIFAMSYFLLPKSLCKKMESQFANFWWQKGKGRKGIHWCQWSHLCRPKNEGGLGFRNMAQFNTAMLAKQGWRFLENPKSLVAQVFKAKYLPNSDFLNSQLGSRNSYAWRSIWAARGILEKGLIWKVGTGSSISIVNDVWVPDLVNSSSSDNKVEVLINRQTREWNREEIEYTFGADEVDKFLRIPLAQSPHDDFLVWRGEPTGVFLVKSTYKLLQSLDPIAYAVNLSLKKLTSDSSCPRCGLGSETLSHLFRDCSVLVDMWPYLTEIQLIQEINGDFQQWLTSCFAFMSLDLCRLFCVALWALWGIGTLGFMKGEAHLSASGVVARDNTGSVLVSKSRVHEKVCSAFAAEALACREAIQLGTDMQEKNVIIEGDSLTVIKKCRQDSIDRSQIGSYIFDIHQKKSVFSRLSFDFIPRSGNILAHLIAKDSLKNRRELYLERGVPLYAEAQARNDSIREPD
ncbi:reverse transcriptase [Gossypium australe]|uniref:Reverse transcriptase n=1 Tax=Gossypium australe TaxID=47621 RepID=A0A5B6X891_9ROSI|nr:reverse transcriptase [Gossypium australe]